jgi:hypothetical protein
MIKRSKELLPDEEVETKKKTTIIKAADESSFFDGVEEVVSPRKADGMLASMRYPIKNSGLIDWRSIIPKEHLALNRFNLAGRGISIENLSQDEISKLIDDAPEEDIVIKLAGFRDLALIRGYSSLVPEVIQCLPDSVTVKVTITWIPNAENAYPLTVGAIANASLNNTDQVFSKFLATIAENRAFIRAVRHSLNIIPIGQDEISVEDSKVEAQNVKIQSLLQKGLDKAGIDLANLKILAESWGFKWNDKWTTVDRIDPAAAMSLIQPIKDLTKE